jgi:hypothetical protein
MTEETGNKEITMKKQDWKRYITVLLPVFIIIGFTIVFSGTSSSSDCGDSDCSSSPANLEGVCGEALNVDKSGTVSLIAPLNAKSGTTDMRCGYGVSWSYSWTKTKTTPKRPPISISVTAGKGGSTKVNSTDTGTTSWSGAYTIARGKVTGTTPVTGTISVTASTTDPTTLLDTIKVNLHLVYSSVKK